MTILRTYLKNRKKELNELLGKFDYQTDKERLNELEQLEKFIERVKVEVNNL